MAEARRLRNEAEAQAEAARRELTEARAKAQRTAADSAAEICVRLLWTLMATTASSESAARERAEKLTAPSLRDQLWCFAGGGGARLCPPHPFQRFGAGAAARLPATVPLQRAAAAAFVASVELGRGRGARKISDAAALQL